ncbi:MAG: hypothetical protein AAF627_00965 [Myxococcota bacterium]
MKTRLSIIALWAIVACDTEDPGLQFNAFKTIENECTFTDANPDLLALTFDPELYDSLRLFGSLQSTLLPPTEILDQPSMRNLPGQITTNINAFEYAFECDISAFAGPRQLFLPFPGNDPAVPLCRNPHDPDADFSGEIVSPVFGSIIGGEITTVATRVVSPQLADQLEEFLELSVPAAACCADTPDGQACDTSAPTVECQTTADLVTEGRILPSQPLELARFREVVLTTAQDPDFRGPLLLGVRGNYRGITNRGASLVSNEAGFNIQLCSNCVNLGFQDLQARAATGDTDAEDQLEEFLNFLNCFEE